MKPCKTGWNGTQLTSECRCYCGEPSHLWFINTIDFRLFIQKPIQQNVIFLSLTLNLPHFAQIILELHPTETMLSIEDYIFICLMLMYIYAFLRFLLCFFYDWSSRDEQNLWREQKLHLKMKRIIRIDFISCIKNGETFWQWDDTSHVCDGKNGMWNVQ